MAKLWFFLSTEWRLEDVQATLNVIISFLSVVTIWTFSRFSWQQSTAEVVKNHNVSLSSLLTLTTLGEALDILRLLKTKILSLHHPRILLQCLVVTLFSVSAILSGPIARYSTRRGHAVRSIEMDGLLATTNHSSMASAMVKWNDTQHSLIKAGFPTDQLLDFLPDPSQDWLYQPEQWNSTWAATCTSILETPLELVGKGDANGIALFDQVPGMEIAVPKRYLDASIYRLNWNYAGFYDQLDNNKDLLVFALFTTDPDLVDDVWASLSFALVAYHVHDSPRNGSSNATFAAGPIGNASYTRLDCDLKRTRPTPDVAHVSYPWTNSTKSIVTAYTDYHRANLVEQSISGIPIAPPSGEEMFQFYQVYMITKDTQYKHVVRRTMSVQLRTVEVSTIFLAFTLLIGLLVLLGITNYILFFRRHRSQLKYIPDTKLEWMLQSIKEAGCGSSGSCDNPFDTVRGPALNYLTMARKELRHEYENSTYGSFDPASQTLGPMRVQLGHARGTVEMVRTVQVPKETYSHGDVGGMGAGLLGGKQWQDRVEYERRVR